MTKTKTEILIKQTQKLNLSLQMKQSLFIMQLNHMQLKSYLKEQLEKNPLLEIEESYFHNHSDDTIQSDFYQEGASLVHVLLEQLTYSSIKNKPLGEYIIYSLDEHGYLKETLANIAKINKVAIKEVKETLLVIQHFEPLGVGAKDMFEALTIQAKERYPNDVLLPLLIQYHLNDIANNALANILTATKSSKEELTVSLTNLKTLNPRPGNGYSHTPLPYIEPDLAFIIEDNQIQIKLSQ